MFAFFYLPIVTPVTSALLIKFFNWIFSYGTKNKQDNIMDDALSSEMIEMVSVLCTCYR